MHRDNASKYQLIIFSIKVVIFIFIFQFIYCSEKMKKIQCIAFLIVALSAWNMRLTASDMVNTQVPISSMNGYLDPDRVTDACEKARRNASNYQNYAAYWITQVEKQNTKISDKNGLINQYFNINSTLTKDRDTYYQNAANCAAQSQPLVTSNAELVAENQRLFDLITKQSASLKTLADNHTTISNAVGQDKSIMSALSVDNTELKKKIAELTQANSNVNNIINENTHLKSQITALNTQIAAMKADAAKNSGSSGGGSSGGGSSGGGSSGGGSSGGGSSGGGSSGGGSSGRPNNKR